MNSFNQNYFGHDSRKFNHQSYGSNSKQAPQSALSTYMLYQQASAISNLQTFYQCNQQSSPQIAQCSAQKSSSARQGGNKTDQLSTTTVHYVEPSISQSSHKDERPLVNENIFQRRRDWSILHKLPIEKQNSIHVRVEDEGPYGNDEIRCFILSHFGSMNVKEINCVFCNTDCVVYDRFPLIDGTLFLSPTMYDRVKSIPSPSSSGKQLFINAVCLSCILCKPGHDIKCMVCAKSWQKLGGRSFQVGTLYKFDLFAGLPCCQSRLECINCQSDLLSIEHAREHCSFSKFSEEAKCLKCGLVAHHFVKNLKDIYLNAKWIF